MMTFRNFVSTVPQPYTLLVPMCVGQADQKLQALQNTYGIAPQVSQDFKAKTDETLLLYPQHPQVQRIMLLGLGEKTNTTDFRRSVRVLVNKQKERLGSHLTVDMSFANPTEGAGFVEAFVNGAILATYRLDFYKTADKQPELFPDFHFIAPQLTEEQIETAIQKGTHIAKGQTLTMDLLNQPANVKTPNFLVKTAQTLAQTYGLTLKTWVGEQLKEAGFSLIWAVGKGSNEPPALIVLEYKHPQAKHTVGLVGKGVTFDTGGISIKPSESMILMKSDLGGAAAVLGTLKTVCEQQLPVNIVAVVCSAENMPDGNAIKPSDVVVGYGGISVEIEDTDAEGRLVLADGLSYITKHYQTDYVIDLATLTGASIVALGLQTAAAFTQNDLLAQKLYEIGLACGEKVWRLPLWDEYEPFIRSDVADFKNLGNGRNGGAITAAKFLEQFTAKHPAWVHLDIAGMVFNENTFSKQRSATGYGVRLLTEWLLSL